MKRSLGSFCKFNAFLVLNFFLSRPRSVIQQSPQHSLWGGGAISFLSSEFACGSLREDIQQKFTYIKFTPYGSAVRYEAKVVEKNEDHNPGAIQSFRKECGIRKGPRLIFQKSVFLIQKLRCGGFAGFSLLLKYDALFS